MIAAPNRGGLIGIVKEEKVVTSCKLHEWLDMIITIYCIEYGGQFLSDLRMMLHAKPLYKQIPLQITKISVIYSNWYPRSTSKLC